MSSQFLQKWAGKVAVVTGASSGIGAATTKLLAENGIIVVGLARRQHLIQLSTGKIYPVKTDLTKEEEVVEAFQWIEKNVGVVHILINCAGISTGVFLDGELKIWKSLFDVNVFALCVATREAVKVMKKNDVSGHIVHVNSIAGHKLLKISGTGVYSVTKHAVTALAHALRVELKKQDTKIKVSSLSPGLVETEMTTLNLNYSEKRVNFFKSMPILKPEDVADAIGYILSTPENVQVEELTITPVGETI